MRLGRANTSLRSLGQSSGFALSSFSVFPAAFHCLPTPSEEPSPLGSRASGAQVSLPPSPTWRCLSSSPGSSTSSH